VSQVRILLGSPHTLSAAHAPDKQKRPREQLASIGTEAHRNLTCSSGRAVAEVRRQSAHYWSAQSKDRQLPKAEEPAVGFISAEPAQPGSRARWSWAEPRPWQSAERTRPRPRRRLYRPRPTGLWPVQPAVAKRRALALSNAQRARMLVACMPFWPRSVSNSTCWPS
jgi:hypothetical protein